MTDDEISELAEFLWARCAEAEWLGLSIVPDDCHTALRCCCPFGAALGTSYPTPFAAYMRMSDITVMDVKSFMNAFGGGKVEPFLDIRLHELGRRFREQALSGEGFR